MGLFTGLIRPGTPPEIKAELEAEQRQMNFTREQNTTASAINPDDDRTYLDEQDRKSDLIRWQQELDSYMFALILSFLSLHFEEDRISPILDEQGKPIPPLCNKLFIHQVVEPKLRPFLSKNLINSNLDEKQILMTQLATANDIADMMSDNYDKYGIDFVNFDGILRDMKNVIKASIYRSYKGFTKKTDNAITKRIESDVYGQQPEQKKGIKALFGA